MAQAFGEDVLENGYNSEVIELDEDRRLVLRVADHREATTLPLAEVEGDVEAAVREAKTREALVALAARQVESLRAGEPLELDWQRADAVSRQGGSALPEALVQAAFRLPHPEGEQPVYGHAVDGERVVLIALERVQDGEPNAQMETFVADMAERLRAQAAIQGLLDDLREKASIERL